MEVSYIDVVNIIMLIPFVLGFVWCTLALIRAIMRLLRSFRND